MTINSPFTHYLKEIFTYRASQALFKGGIALLGVALIASAEVGPFLYDRDTKAEMAAIELSQTDIDDVGKVDCESIAVARGKCVLDKHELQKFRTSMAFFEEVVMDSLHVGAALIVIAVSVFFLVPIMQGKMVTTSD